MFLLFESEDNKKRIMINWWFSLAMRKNRGFIILKHDPSFLPFYLYLSCSKGSNWNHL